jgi:hypothetical protein
MAEIKITEGESLGQIKVDEPRRPMPKGPPPALQRKRAATGPKIIAKIVAGSRLYGLDTPESDTDTRGVFLNTDPATILGLERLDLMKRDDADVLLFEFRHFLSGLRKTNTNMLEILFAEDEEFQILEPEFSRLKENRKRLVDSERLFGSMLGYIENERRLATGERRGKIGGKRREKLERYGFSPKNFSHLFRLARCGTAFFKTGEYPVNIRKRDPEFAKFLFSVKTEPEKFSRDELESMVPGMMSELEKSFRERTEDLKFDEELANRLCLEVYLPYLN